MNPLAVCVDIENAMNKSKDVAFSFLKFYDPSISHAIERLNNLVRKIPLLKEGKLGERELTLFGKFDYWFEWVRYPSADEIISVLKEIDEVIADSGVWYTITTKGHALYKQEDYKIPINFIDKRR